MVSDVKRSEDIPPVKADPKPMNPKPETLNLDPKPWLRCGHGAEVPAPSAEAHRAMALLPG